MQRALILSVGTGTGPTADIVSPLVKSIADSNPQFVCLLVSEVSEPNALEIIARLNLVEGSFEVYRLSSSENVVTIFKDALEAIRRVTARGYAHDEIVADYTSGTKAMTAGLVLAATTTRCGSLRYISGSRAFGTVAPGTEHFLSIPPAGILAHRELELARELLLSLQFRGALDRCAAINPALLDSYSGQTLSAIECLARGYDAWDKFDHRRFVGEYGKAAINRTELVPFRIAKDVPTRLIAIGKAIEQNQITADLLADLFDNAERRHREGKYDDAVGRLYRLTEMLAQRELARFGIATADVDAQKVPPTLADSFDRLRDPDDGKIRIALRRSYRLLAALDSSLGDAFERSKKLPDALTARNESILAHGTRPIGAGAAGRLRDAVLELAQIAVPDFQQRARELQFPWVASA